MSRHDDLLRQLDGVCVDLADVTNALRGRDLTVEQFREFDKRLWRVIFAALEVKKHTAVAAKGISVTPDFGGPPGWVPPEIQRWADQRDAEDADDRRQALRDELAGVR